MEGGESETGWTLWADYWTSIIPRFSLDVYGLIGLRYTFGVLGLILFCQLLLKSRRYFIFFRLLGSRRDGLYNPPCSSNISDFKRNSASSAAAASSLSQFRISVIVSDFDLKCLIDNLDDKRHTDDTWENVIDRRNDLIYYSAKCCKPKDGPLKYLSVTVFENCSPVMLRNFYMDNDYRKTWDKTIVEHHQLQVDKMSGTEIGQTIKKFPLLTPREYVLAWRLWEGENQSFYCFSKECEHHLAPIQKKYVRVGFFRSGWRIRKVPGRNACEIKMVHQEDSGLNVEMAKLAFAKGIWSYVCKMDNALRKYSASHHIPQSPAVSAITLIQKVPPELDDVTSQSPAGTSKESIVVSQVAHECNKRRLSRRPSSKLIANGLIVLGGVFCLTRGHSDLGAKVAMSYILSKFTKRSASARQN